MQKEVFSRLPDALLPWYDAGHRELPWRQTKDPYKIWLSEIMLQQTRVEAVKGYYARFLDALPNIPTLAEADDELLHKLWEGLGYYNRVRNLKKAARQIMELGGEFPREYDTVLALAGIGEYTAGAICSIAFEKKTPAVDGNVLRLVARLTADETPIDLPAYKKQVRQALEEVYPDRAGDFTQALIELGATVCGPNKAPDCENCPCAGFCKAREMGMEQQLPVKLPKRGRRQEEKTVLILSCGDALGLCKRPDKGLLASLWEFPNFPGKADVEAALAKVEELGLKPREIIKQVERKHIFTHVEWDMRGVYMEVAEPKGTLSWHTREQLEKDAALPTAFRLFLEDTENV